MVCTGLKENEGSLELEVVNNEPLQTYMAQEQGHLAAIGQPRCRARGLVLEEH